MAKLTPQEMAAKWSGNLANSTAYITKGVQQVTVSPTEQAARKKDKMLQNLTKAVNDGSWEAGLRRVSLQDWQQAMVQKGIARIPQGAQAATNKFADFAGKLLPYQDTLKTKIDAMPDLTIQDSANRMLAWMQGMSQFKK